MLNTSKKLSKFLRRIKPLKPHRLEFTTITSRSFSPTTTTEPSTTFIPTIPHILFTTTAAPFHSKCWNCHANPNTTPFLFCDSCRTIQPVDHSVNYFQIFSLENKYEMEERGLEAKYKHWQKKLHPDLVHSKPPKEREFAAEQSARVTDAYRTLINPRLRALYIMRLQGVDVDEEETISDAELLAEVMEIREAVEEAPDAQALNDIKSQIDKKLQHWYNAFAKAFQDRKFENALTCIRRMTYYDRVNEEIVKRL